VRLAGVSSLTAAWLQEETRSFKSSAKDWSRRPGLNGRPAVYETAALPTELRRLFGKKRPYPITGFSQASRGISLRGPFEK
jgi:hypothetical protein